MRNSFLLIFTLIAFTISSCEKEDIPCTTFPCGDENNYYGNRVAWDPDFRIGTWINVREGSSDRDTIIFHNEERFSYFNSQSGYFNTRYTFDYRDLVLLEDHNGNTLQIPIEYETGYNDTTGIFSIIRQKTLIIGGGIDFDIDFYIKIK